MKKEFSFVPLFPNQKQAEFLVSLTDFDINIVAYVGGAGAGKTQAGVMSLIDAGVNTPDGRQAVVRKFAKDHKDTIWSEFTRSVDPRLIIEERLVDKEIILRTTDPKYPNHILFRGLDERGRWGSQAFDKIIVEEASEIDVQDFLYLLTRLRHKPRVVNPDSPYTRDDGRVHRYLVLLFNPPPQRDHWLRSLCVERKLFGRNYNIRVIQTRTTDNKENLDDSYLQVLDHLPEQEKLRMVDGEWSLGITGTPCTPDFRLDTHVFEGPVPKHPIPIKRGWDFGFNHPAVFIGELRGDCLYIWREVLPEQLWVRDLIRNHVNPAQAEFHHECDITDYCDHQHINQKTDKSPKSTKEIMIDEGLQPKHKFSKPRDRAQLVNYLLQNNRLFVHKSCKNLILALSGGWHMDEDNADPEKDGFFEHLGDALGYLCIGPFGFKGYKKARGSVINKPMTGKVQVSEDLKERRTKDRSGPGPKRSFNFSRR